MMSIKHGDICRPYRKRLLCVILKLQLSLNACKWYSPYHEESLIDNVVHVKKLSDINRVVAHSPPSCQRRHISHRSPIHEWYRCVTIDKRQTKHNHGWSRQQQEHVVQSMELWQVGLVSCQYNSRAIDYYSGKYVPWYAQYLTSIANYFSHISRAPVILTIPGE